VDVADIHHSNPLRQFAGPESPEGIPYVWATSPDGTKYLLARNAPDGDPEMYELLLEYNECTLGLTLGDAAADAPASDAADACAPLYPDGSWYPGLGQCCTTEADCEPYQLCCELPHGNHCGACQISM
jgi:hypothetical protein